MRLKTLFGLWLPLAVSFEMMMLEGPTVQGAIGRLPHPELHLAAWGLTMSLALLVESPVIMLLATAIALVRDAPSYFALRRFMLSLALGCTLLTALVAFTPLFELVASKLMGQPAHIVQAARPALQIMLFWIAAIAWRRFYQGILVGHGRTRMVSWGTVFRLVATVGTAYALASWGKLPGAQVGAVALMVAVVTEAIATSCFALPIVREEVVTRPPEDTEELTQAAIWRFHMPLATTTLFTLLAPPITSAALARLDAKPATIAAMLAAWPVTAMLLLVMRGWGLALQEITVAQAKRPEAHPTLQRFTWLVGGVTTAVTALIAFTPLLDLYLKYVVHIPVAIWPYVRVGVGAGCALPLITALGSWARGLLVTAGKTQVVYQGMGINLATHGLCLALGVVLHLPGMWMAAGAFTLAAVVEYVYLSRRALALYALRPEYAV